MDRKQVALRRIDNSAPSPIPDSPGLLVEYQNRLGEIETEDLSMSFLRDASVSMYKRRAKIPNPIELLTRRRYEITSALQRVIVALSRAPSAKP